MLTGFHPTSLITYFQYLLMALFPLSNLEMFELLKATSSYLT